MCKHPSTKRCWCWIKIIVVYRSPYERHKSARWMPRPRMAMKDATNLRKASGRRFVAFDPEISEWGNPPVLNWNPRGNSCAMRTRGSETSQYPEEKRTRGVAFRWRVCSCQRNATLVIPRVAASEKGKAQTPWDNSVRISTDSNGKKLFGVCARF